MKNVHKFSGAIWIGIFGMAIILLINSLNSYGRGIGIVSRVSKSSSEIYKNMITAGNFAEKSDFESAKKYVAEAENLSEEIKKELWFLTGPNGAQIIKIGEYLTKSAGIFLDIVNDINSLGIGFIDVNSDTPKAYPISNRISKINQEYADFIKNISLAESVLNEKNIEFLPDNFKEKINSFSDKIKKIKNLLPPSPAFVSGLSSILGEKQKQTMLILLQNDAESRPTGGFIGSVLLANVENGKINFEFQDVYDIDRNFKETVEPPAEIKKLTDKWFFRDSNYSPDFAVSAKKSIWFYEKETGVKVDTVIAINQSLLKSVLELTGEIHVPGLSSALNKDNYQTVLSYIIESKLTGVYQPKKILKDFVEEFKKSIFKVQDKKRFIAVIMKEIVNANMLGYSENGDIQALFRFIGMNGEIIKTKESEDYLNVVAVSIGGNKSDAYIDQKITHMTYANEDGEVNDEVTIERFNNFSRQKGDEIKKMLAKFGYRNVPNWVMQILGKSKNKAIFRVYVPKGAELKDQSGRIKDLQKMYDPDLDRDYFSFISETRPGQTTKITLRYTLPFELDFDAADTYRLIFQRQPGMINTKFEKKYSTEKSLKIIGSYSSKNMYSALIAGGL